MKATKKSRQVGASGCDKDVISDLSREVGWVLCDPSLPISEGWLVVSAVTRRRATMRKISGGQPAQNCTLHDVFGRSDGGLRRLKIVPGVVFSLGEIPITIDKVEAGAELPRALCSSPRLGAFALDLQKVANLPLFEVSSSSLVAEKAEISNSSSDSSDPEPFHPVLEQSLATAFGEQAATAFLSSLQDPLDMLELTFAALAWMALSALPLFKESFVAALAEHGCREASGLGSAEAVRLLSLGFDEIGARKGLTQVEVFKCDAIDSEAALSCLRSILESLECSSSCQRKMRRLHFSEKQHRPVSTVAFQETGQNNQLTS